MTSSDVLDTSLALQLRDAASLLLSGVDRVLTALSALNARSGDALMAGRSHGIHAEPMTFGHKLATFGAEFQRAKQRLQQAKKVISFGKIAGAVGNYAHLSPDVERLALASLGLEVEPASTQVVPRDRHAEYFMHLAVVASSVERAATEIRHLQRTELREVEEPFGKGQKGSSAMPHKRNPVLSENLTGLARLVRSYAQAALDNVALWHERDISHSSVERVIAPDATIALDFMLQRLADIFNGLSVFPETMAKGLELTGGAMYSQRLLLKLAAKGTERQKAYEIVQRCAMRWYDEGVPLHQAVAQDAELTALLSEEERASCFSLEPYRAGGAAIQARVFGPPKP